MAVRKGTRLLQQVGLTQANSSKFGRFVEAVLHFSCNLILFSGFGPGEVSSPRPVHWAGTQVEPANTSYFVSSWKRKLRLNPTSMENSCIISKSGVQFSCRPTFTERGGLPRDPGVRGHIFKFQRKQRSNFFLRLTVQNCAGHISPEEQGNWVTGPWIRPRLSMLLVVVRTTCVGSAASPSLGDTWRIVAADGLHGDALSCGMLCCVWTQGPNPPDKHYTTQVPSGWASAHGYWLVTDWSSEASLAAHGKCWVRWSWNSEHWSDLWVCDSEMTSVDHTPSPRALRISGFRLFQRLTLASRTPKDVVSTVKKFYCIFPSNFGDILMKRPPCLRCNSGKWAKLARPFAASETCWLPQWHLATPNSIPCSSQKTLLTQMGIDFSPDMDLASSPCLSKATRISAPTPWRILCHSLSAPCPWEVNQRE